MEFKDTAAEARVIFGLCMAPPSGIAQSLDRVFALVSPDDFVYFNMIYAALADSFSAGRLLSAAGRAKALSAAVQREIPPHEGYWRMLAHAARWPSEFTLMEDSSRLRLLRIRRTEYLLSMHLQSRVLNERRSAGLIVLESREKYDVLAQLVSDSEELLKWLPQYATALSDP